MLGDYTKKAVYLHQTSFRFEQILKSGITLTFNNTGRQNKISVWCRVYNF